VNDGLNCVFSKVTRTCDTKALGLEAMRRGTRLIRGKVVVVRTVRPKDIAQLLLRVGLTRRL
jgi:hypothetical protein